MGFKVSRKPWFMTRGYYGGHGDGEPPSRKPKPKVVQALAVVERPEDCSNEDCFRHGGKGPCSCDDKTEGGTWQPGC